MLKNFNVQEKSLEVLYIDDLKMNQYILEELFRDMNVNLDTCDSAIESYKLCEKKEYDFILIDIQMPEIDGITAYKHIRANSTKNWKTPIAAFTASQELPTSSKYLEIGFCSYLNKPISKKKLRKIINEVGF